MSWNTIVMKIWCRDSIQNNKNILYSVLFSVSWLREGQRETERESMKQNLHEFCYLLWITYVCIICLAEIYLIEGGFLKAWQFNCSLFVLNKWLSTLHVHCVQTVLKCALHTHRTTSKMVFLFVCFSFK